MKRLGCTLGRRISPLRRDSPPHCIGRSRGRKAREGDPAARRGTPAAASPERSPAAGVLPRLRLRAPEPQAHAPERADMRSMFEPVEAPEPRACSKGWRACGSLSIPRLSRVAELPVGPAHAGIARASRPCTEGAQLTLAVRSKRARPSARLLPRRALRGDVADRGPRSRALLRRGDGVSLRRGRDRWTRGGSCRGGRRALARAGLPGARRSGVGRRR